MHECVGLLVVLTIALLRSAEAPTCASMRWSQCIVDGTLTCAIHGSSMTFTPLPLHFANRIWSAGKNRKTMYEFHKVYVVRVN